MRGKLLLRIIVVVSAANSDTVEISLIPLDGAIVVLVSPQHLVSFLLTVSQYSPIQLLGGVRHCENKMFSRRQ